MTNKNNTALFFVTHDNPATLFLRLIGYGLEWDAFPHVLPPKARLLTGVARFSENTMVVE